MANFQTHTQFDTPNLGIICCNLTSFYSNQRAIMNIRWVLKYKIYESNRFNSVKISMLPLRHTNNVLGVLYKEYRIQLIGHHSKWLIIFLFLICLKCYLTLSYQAQHFLNSKGER